MNRFLARYRWGAYFTRPMFTILLLGFSSGLPLALTAATLGFWLSEAGIDKSAIGLFAAVALPYTLKFLWAPFLDAFPAPLLARWLGRRRGWMLLTQVGLIASITALGATSPAQQLMLTALLAFLVSFLSASQDTVIDAYRVESLPADEQGEGAAMIQLGYRLGMLASGAGAFWLVGALGWHGTYLAMAALMLTGVMTTLFCPEPPAAAAPAQPGGILRNAVIAPFADFIRRDRWLLILTFVLLFKFGDAFLGVMTSPFFRELGFDKRDIADIVKFYGTFATIFGTLLGGTLTARYGAMRVLFLSGLLHAATNLLYVVQARAGADLALLGFGISLENFTGGISAAAFVAYLSLLCSRNYTATQYALLSSLAAFGRTILSTPAGWVANILGWQGFFLFSAALALPGLAVLMLLGKRIRI